MSDSEGLVFEAAGVTSVLPCARQHDPVTNKCDPVAATELTLRVDDVCEAGRVRPGFMNIIRLIQRIQCIREVVVTVSCRPHVHAHLMTTLQVLHSLLLVHAFLVLLRMLVHLLVVL